MDDKKEITFSEKDLPDLIKLLKFLGKPLIINAQAIGIYFKFKKDGLI